MKEVFENILNIYYELNKIGINIVSISMTIILVDFLKTKVFSKMKFYKNECKNILNLFLGLLLSFTFAVIIYNFKQWNNILLTSIVGFVFSVASHNIIKAFIKLIPSKK